MDDQKELTPFGGKPTDAEVELLLAKWQDLAPGGVASYRDVEKTIGVTRDYARFWTVTQRWRKEYEKATGIIIGCDAGKLLFVALTPSQRVGYAISQARKGRRRTRRAHNVAVKNNALDLTPEERLINQQEANRTGILMQAASRHILRMSTATPDLTPSAERADDADPTS